MSFPFPKRIGLLLLLLEPENSHQSAFFLSFGCCLMFNALESFLLVSEWQAGRSTWPPLFDYDPHR